MQQQITLQVPTPCHANWNEMEPFSVSKDSKTTNRFCGSCQKTVVNFTSMTDVEVLSYFTTKQGNTCGRFVSDQLNRVLATPTPPKKSWCNWLMAALISGFMLPSKVKAQAKLGKVQIQQLNNNLQIVGDTTAKPQKIVLGGVASIPRNQQPNYLFAGNVSDENNNPIIGASVVIKGSKTGAVTDAKGKFSILGTMDNLNLILQISCVGYQVVEREFNPQAIENINIDKQQIQINLKPIALLQTDIVFAGEVVVIRKPKKINKVVDTLNNILPKIKTSAKNSLLIAPNPAKAGNIINVGFEKAGKYNLQLFNIQSILLANENVAIETDGGKTLFNLPASLAKGEYIFNAINTTDKKQYSGKLIVQ